MTLINPITKEDAINEIVDAAKKLHDCKWYDIVHKQISRYDLSYWVNVLLKIEETEEAV